MSSCLHPAGDGDAVTWLSIELSRQTFDHRLLLFLHIYSIHMLSKQALIYVLGLTRKMAQYLFQLLLRTAVNAAHSFWLILATKRKHQVSVTAFSELGVKLVRHIIAWFKVNTTKIFRRKTNPWNQTGGGIINRTIYIRDIAQAGLALGDFSPHHRRTHSALYGYKSERRGGRGRGKKQPASCALSTSHFATNRIFLSAVSLTN